MSLFTCRVYSRKNALILLFLVIHLSFYVATLWTDHLQLFYPQGTIQKNKTLDYTTIPNGARTFLEGGPLNGIPRTYKVVENPHHPAITLTLGLFLQIFDIPTGFKVFTVLKILVTSGMFFLLYRKFHEHENFLLASFVFLTFFDQGAEINCGQYWFVLNCFIFFFLYSLQCGHSSFLSSFWYLGTLITKPIGLLWIPQLVIKRKFRVVVVALSAYVLLSLAAYVLLPGGDYFLSYLFGTAVTLPSPDNLPRYTLPAILHYFGADAGLTEVLKYVVLSTLMLITVTLRLPLISGLMIWTSYSLLFYPLTYTYHYTCLVPFLTLGLLTSREFNDRFVKGCAVLLCLPTPYCLFKLFNLFPVTLEKVQQSPWSRDIVGEAFDESRNLSDEGIVVMMCLKVVTLIAMLSWIVVQSRSKRIQQPPEHGSEQEGRQP